MPLGCGDATNAGAVGAQSPPCLSGWRVVGLNQEGERLQIERTGTCRQVGRRMGLRGGNIWGFQPEGSVPRRGDGNGKETQVQFMALAEPDPRRHRSQGEIDRIVIVMGKHSRCVTRLLLVTELLIVGMMVMAVSVVVMMPRIMCCAATNM